MNEPLRQRRPPLEDRVFLERVRELPCAVCGRSGPSDAAHLRMAGAPWGYPDKPYTGGGEKPSDCYVTPLCRPVYSPDPVARKLKPDAPLKLVNVGCHGRQHGHDAKVLRELTDNPEEKLKLEEAFWRSTGKNPFQIAQVLYDKFGTGLRPRKKKRQPKADRPPRKPRTTVKPKGFGDQKRKMQSRPFDKTVKRKLPKRKKP